MMFLLTMLLIPYNDVSFNNVADASPDVTHEAPDPVAFDVNADDDAVEVTIDEPTNTYNLRSRSAPAFGSYSNPNNHINLQSTEQPYLHHQAQANTCHLSTFDEVRAGYNPSIGELLGMTYQYLVNTQMNTTKGIKLHGECAIEAILKKFAQLGNMNTFKPIKADSISKQERRKALRPIYLIKEKCDGTLKGRTCAEGRSQ